MTISGRSRTSSHADDSPSPVPANEVELESLRARSSETDEALIDRLRDGDRVAFDELYNRYFKRIYAFLDRRLRNRADTEETTQEVFINVFSSIDSFRGDAPFAAWIFGLTRRTLAARFKRKRHPMVPLGDDHADRLSGGNHAASISPIGPTATATPLEQYEGTERAAALLEVLENQLSADQRTIFEMHHLESLPIAEIAKRLDRTEDSIKSNLYRSRKVLLAR